MKFSPQHSARKLSFFRSNQKNNARFLGFWHFLSPTKSPRRTSSNIKASVAMGASMPTCNAPWCVLVGKERLGFRKMSPYDRYPWRIHGTNGIYAYVYHKNRVQSSHGSVMGYKWSYGTQKKWPKIISVTPRSGVGWAPTYDWFLGPLCKSKQDLFGFYQQHYIDEHHETQNTCEKLWISLRNLN